MYGYKTHEQGPLLNALIVIGALVVILLVILLVMGIRKCRENDKDTFINMNDNFEFSPSEAYENVGSNMEFSNSRLNDADTWYVPPPVGGTNQEVMEDPWLNKSDSVYNPLKLDIRPSGGAQLRHQNSYESPINAYSGYLPGTLGIDVGPATEPYAEESDVYQRYSESAVRPGINSFLGGGISMSCSRPYPKAGVDVDEMEPEFQHEDLDALNAKKYGNARSWRKSRVIVPSIAKDIYDSINDRAANDRAYATVAAEAAKAPPQDYYGVNGPAPAGSNYIAPFESDREDYSGSFDETNNAGRGCV